MLNKNTVKSSYSSMSNVTQQSMTRIYIYIYYIERDIYRERDRYIDIDIDIDIDIKNFLTILAIKKTVQGMLLVLRNILRATLKPVA